jgi:hypothetical protein
MAPASACENAGVGSINIITLLKSAAKILLFFETTKQNKEILQIFPHFSLF